MGNLKEAINLEIAYRKSCKLMRKEIARKVFLQEFLWWRYEKFLMSTEEDVDTLLGLKRTINA